MPVTHAPAAPWETFLSCMKTADGAFAVDRAQHIIHWSSAAQQVLGYAPDEVLGRRCYEVVAGRDPRNFRFCHRRCPIMVSAQRGRPSSSYDILSHTSDGTELWLNMSVLILPAQKGRPMSVLHLFRDVTSRRQIEQQANRAMSTLRELLEEHGQEKTADAISDGSPTPLLSRREAEVLRLLACGLSTLQISESLGVSPLTARNHITRLMVKLGVETRLQAVLYASQHKLF